MVLVIEHVEHEGPGLIGEALGRFELCRPWRGDEVPEFPAHDALVVLGGSMAAWDDAAHANLAREARLLAASARAGLPTLGICLGAQLLARGLGARNFRGPTLEKGLFPLTLTDEGRDDLLLREFDGARVAHWHEDTFDLPPGALRLASSSLYEQQAFRVGERTWGVQFHVECDQAARVAWGLDAGPTPLGVDRERRFAQRFAELVFSLQRR